MRSPAAKKKLTKRSVVKPGSVASNCSSMAPSSRPNLSCRRLMLLTPAVLLLFFFALSSVFPGRSFNFVLDSSPVALYAIQVVNEFPHDPRAFTQGLLYAENDTLFESTGLYGQSSIRKVALMTGKVQNLYKLDSSHFGEGLTLFGDRLFQVTWLKKTGFIYDRFNLSKVESFSHQMDDGWGLATDGKILFGSDGTSKLYQLDAHTLEVIAKTIVKYNGHEVHNLNELEYINGEVWANIWMSDCIARISPTDGKVIGWILLHKLREGLIEAGHHGFDVLNGIAWDSEKERLFVTGKLWPKLYEIKPHRLQNDYNNEFIEKLCLRKPHDFTKS